MKVKGKSASPRAPRRRPAEAVSHFEQTLEHYRSTVMAALLEYIPRGGPPYLYDLVSVYPSRPGKCLRAALCLATCGALGGTEGEALNSAVAIELFHNAFLIHDDIQDQSICRRGASTLHKQHGTGIAINIGNATNLLGLQRILQSRQLLGAEASWLIAQETERMMRHSLEGQAIELSWIRDNACSLEPHDYLQMCLKKTSWYSFIYPMRVGATVAQGSQHSSRFCKFGWYLGAAFQIQDDILNLTGKYAKYGKEIGGDLREGKRTLMLIRLLKQCSPRERRRLEGLLCSPQEQRSEVDLSWIHDRMLHYNCIDSAKRAARELAGAAFLEAMVALRGVPDSSYKQFILELVLYVVNRDR